MRKDLADLWLLAEPPIRDAGFDLIEVQFGREHSGTVLRLFIDTPEGSGGSVTHEDCERVSRDVSAALDVADNISHAYQLEVSSPGLDRPLRRERDFARFVGESARIRLNDGVEGRRNFSGTLRSAKDGRVEIACDGRSYELPLDDIARANLIPDWDREFALASFHDSVGEGPLSGPDDRVGGEPASPARPHRGGAWGPFQGPHSKRSPS